MGSEARRGEEYTTKLRSGHFEDGEQVGEWITYDRDGQKYKVTRMKPEAE